MTNKLTITMILFRFSFFILISYGMLYFSYKFYSPLVGGGSDFFQYYNMYLNPLDFDVAKSPFIYRQFSAVITFFIIESGIYYDAEIVFNNPIINQHVFFGVLLSNYIALLLTVFIVSRIVDLEIKNITVLAPIMAGLLCFMSFGTFAWVLTGLVEGWTWFLVALGYYAFRKKNIYLFFIVVFLAVFQKEVISIILGTITFTFLLFTYFKNANVDKKVVYMFILSLVGFLSYIVIRKFLLPVAGNENQLDWASLVSTLMTIDMLNMKFLMPTLMSQNLLYLLFILIVAMIYKNNNKLATSLKIEYIIAILSSFIILSFIGIATGIGSNIGRITLVLSPIVSVYIAYYMYLLDKK